MIIIRNFNYPNSLKKSFFISHNILFRNVVHTSCQLPYSPFASHTQVVNYSSVDTIRKLCWLGEVYYNNISNRAPHMCKIFPVSGAHSIKTRVFVAITFLYYCYYYIMTTVLLAKCIIIKKL